ncbi:ABC-2 type transporter [Candidatus Promineifilum breve]|uniref:Transport permease protein n=1 Tax=Candidatus Promineifilum breve TaxID=1806508 RepID=A0A160T475_9CHLR|nr:ABC transporter permease [Candidatus Promineifilum breve]CUS04169.2 ABC-2 type transporter [Candidatus Promineifilum breve]
MKSEPIIIEPVNGWQVINWRELRDYRDLFRFLIDRDIKVLYKQTVLGFGWAVLRPLLSMIIFTVIFGNLAQVDSDGVPYAIFSYVALVPWLYFSTALSSSALSLVNNTDMLTKIYFPRLVFPMTPVVSKLVDFAVSFVIVFALMAWFRIHPTIGMIYLPLLVALMMLTAAGLGLWFAAMSVQYRDVKHAMPFLTQILMYAAPVVWSGSLIAERFGQTGRYLFGLYPMVGVIEGFRSALLGTVPMPWDMIAIGAVSALVLFVTGLFYFRRMESTFADVA